jgi:DNA-binding CsgD family transcriptional regulator
MSVWCPTCGRKRSHGYTRTMRCFKARLAGATIEAIALVEGVHVNTVRAHLRKAGIVRGKSYFVSMSRAAQLGVRLADVLAAGATEQQPGFYRARNAPAQEESPASQFRRAGSVRGYRVGSV